MNKLTDINKDFSGWYQDVIFQAEIVDSSPTRGCMVIRPYGYSIWENIVKQLDKEIKDLGANNAYFPLLIPESFLKKEAEHVEGFAPEVAVVTHAGGKKLEEPLVIRPTSETMIYYMFARWIQSWRDLPLKINQWANVMRWEMRPRAFLRTAEFLWQEGHTAHESKEEADKMAKDALKMYKDFIENVLAIPVIAGVKTDSERFAGADKTYCVEAIMPDGKALQMGTSHLLSHSFPESFGITFQDKNGKESVPHCSSWGVSTRMIGGLLMSHGDETGIVLPPRVAPIQVVIVPIFRKEEDKALVYEKVDQIKIKLSKAGVRVSCDYSSSKTPGAKFFHWEMKGVPLRIELGPRDIENNQIVLASRIEKDKAKKKKIINFDNIEESVLKSLCEIQNYIFESAKSRLKSAVKDGDKIENFSSELKDGSGVFETGWCGSSECEAKLKDCKGSIRAIVGEDTESECFACKAKSVSRVVIAKSY